MSRRHKGRSDSIGKVRRIYKIDKRCKGTGYNEPLGRKRGLPYSLNGQMGYIYSNSQGAVGGFYKVILRIPPLGGDKQFNGL